MPRVDADERLLSVPTLTLNLKRGRAGEPASPCFEKCCAMTAPSPSLKLKLKLKLKRGGLTADSDLDLALAFPQDEADESEEDFELGPPPSAPPMLCRQNAMDATAARQAKLCRSVAGAGFSSRSSPVSSSNEAAFMSMSMSTPLPPRSSLSLSSSSSRVRGFMVAPAMVHPSLALPN